MKDDNLGGGDGCGDGGGDGGSDGGGGGGGGDGVTKQWLAYALSN